MENPYFKLFNQKADEFFKDLAEGFPKTPEYEKVIIEFKTLKSSFNLLKNVNEKTPQRVFRDYVLVTYRDKIVNQDESFFLDKNDFEITSKRKEYWMDFIDKIKAAWSSMDDQNKDIIWKYFKLLVFLSDKCDNKTI
jgi:hypothetical protein